MGVLMVVYIVGPCVWYTVQWPSIKAKLLRLLISATTITKSLKGLLGLTTKAWNNLSNMDNQLPTTIRAPRTLENEFQRNTLRQISVILAECRALDNYSFEHLPSVWRKVFQLATEAKPHWVSCLKTCRYCAFLYFWFPIQPSIRVSQYIPGLCLVYILTFFFHSISKTI